MFWGRVKRLQPAKPQGEHFGAIPLSIRLSKRGPGQKAKHCGAQQVPGTHSLTFRVGKPVIPKSEHTCWLSSSAQSMAARITAGLHSVGTEHELSTPTAPENTLLPTSACGDRRDLLLCQRQRSSCSKITACPSQDSRMVCKPRAVVCSGVWCPTFQAAGAQGKPCEAGGGFAHPALLVLEHRQLCPTLPAWLVLPVQPLPQLLGRGHQEKGRDGLRRARNTGSSLSQPRPRAQLITKREQPKTSSQARALQQSLPRF